LVIDAMRKIASGGIGAFELLSRKPTVSKYAIRPFRATTTTAPGIRPRSTSARRICPMRSSLSDESPTSSAFARGSGSAAAPATRSSEKPTMSESASAFMMRLLC
jgi:hypothetical protein